MEALGPIMRERILDMEQKNGYSTACSHMRPTVKDIGKAIIGFDRGIGDEALGHLLVEYPRSKTADALRKFFRDKCNSDMGEFARQYASRRFALETVEQTFVMPGDVRVYRQTCNRVLNQLYKGH
jgi:hypothetical protein